MTLRIKTAFNGNKTYYKDNKWHREDGPAKENIDGYEEWRQNGKLHCDDGPAIVRPAWGIHNGKEWWRYGDLYFKIPKRGMCLWYRFGYKFQQKYNPNPFYWYPNYSAEYTNRMYNEQYYLDHYSVEKANDKNYRFPEDCLHPSMIYISSFFFRNDDDFILREYYDHGLKHRIDGPAVVMKIGIEEWWYEGKLHRIDGPAFEYKNKEGFIGSRVKSGDKEWWQNGKLHRIGGPAIEYQNLKVWCQNGEIYRENDLPAIYFYDAPEKFVWITNGKIHRDNAPAIVSSDGYSCWYKNGEIHRDGAPALVSSTGCSRWYKNGKLHRIDGPAVEIDKSGNKNHWYQEGHEIFQGKAIYVCLKVAVALSPLDLPAYVVQWILEYVDSNIAKVNQVRLINILQGIRESRKKIILKR